MNNNSDETYNGVILKGIGGFYYVKSATGVFECKGKGLFRKSGTVLVAGDGVRITVRSDAENTIDELYTRRNHFMRPPVANVTRLVVVSSSVQPAPVPLIIDRLTAIAVDKGVQPVVVFTKTDIKDTGDYEEIYKTAGIPVFSVCCTTGEGGKELAAFLNDGLNVFTGNTGVGKSSLLNVLNPGIVRQTGEISRKLGRGRHTTREVELFEFGDGFIADTPGFSALDTSASEIISKDNLPFCFPEFLPYLGKCRFSTCTHTVDKGCCILDAVSAGIIHPSRHESYVAMYNETKNIQDWQL